MFGVWVKVRVRPDQRERFLAAIEVDAIGSEREEPGCLRFNVLKNPEEENTYYFYEVYADQTAFEAHQSTPHYETWKAAADTLDGPPEVTRLTPLFPADAQYWRKT